MRAEYDLEARALYIYTEHPGVGKQASASRTVKLEEDNESIWLDYGEDDKLLGIEVLLSEPLQSHEVSRLSAREKELEDSLARMAYQHRKAKERIQELEEDK